MLYPGISPPTFTGPHDVTVTCNGNDVKDFTFECGIQYKAATDIDVAVFDVALAFDGVVNETTIKTTTAASKTVVFNSSDIPQGQFGKQVKPINQYTLNII